MKAFVSELMRLILPFIYLHFKQMQRYFISLNIVEDGNIFEQFWMLFFDSMQFDRKKKRIIQFNSIYLQYKDESIYLICLPVRATDSEAKINDVQQKEKIIEITKRKKERKLKVNKPN